MLRSRSPAVVLLLLAPVVGELLNGATRLSFAFALLPQILVWGCGTLLIREAVRRWRGGPTSILALALGLSIWVEFFVLQTSLAPLPCCASLTTASGASTGSGSHSCSGTKACGSSWCPS
jgi:hypothetical protein